MLRQIVQLVAAAVALLGVWLIVAGATAAGMQALLLGVVLFVAVRYEGWRDRARPPTPGSHWHPTGERFEDPGTGKTVEVQYNAQTGERRYRSDDEG